MLVTKLVRSLLSDRRILREADKDTGGGSLPSIPATGNPADIDQSEAETSPGMRELTREEIGEFEGSEMLIGATVPLEQGEESPTPTPTPTQEDEAPTAEATHEEAEEEPAPAEDKSWPETARKRVDALTAQKSELARERDELKAKIEAKAPPITGPVATPDNPLADVTDDAELAARQSLAERLEDWADEHRDGGELPRALQAALEGKKPEEITEARDLSGDEARQLYRNAKKMLRNHLPERREWLQHAKGNEKFMREQFPEFFDLSTPEGQHFAEIERQMPQIKTIARWPAAIAAIVTGDALLWKRYQAKTGQAKAAAPKADPPTAPVPPSTGARGASASKPATAKPRRETALTAAMSDDEIMSTM